jgi:DNA polymerase-1
MPNIQAIRKRPWDEGINVDVHMRDMVVPPPGRELVSIDFDQLHLRMVAYLSGEQQMIELYEQGGDIHELMCHKMFGDKYDPKNSNQRRKAKDVNYGFVYGATREKIKKYSGLPWLYDHLQETFPHTPAFLREKEHEARRTGCVICADGTRLFLPKEKAYAAVNYFIQGTEGYLMKRCITDLYVMLRKAVIVAQIHDELLLEADVGWHRTHEFGKVCQVMRKAGVGVGIPYLEISAKVTTEGGSWYRSKKISITKGK